MICDYCGHAVFALIEVVTERYVKDDIETTQTEEWCLTCIMDYYSHLQCSKRG